MVQRIYALVACNFFSSEDPPTKRIDDWGSIFIVTALGQANYVQTTNPKVKNLYDRFTEETKKFH